MPVHRGEVQARHGTNRMMRLGDIPCYDLQGERFYHPSLATVVDSDCLPRDWEIQVPRTVTASDLSRTSYPQYIKTGVRRFRLVRIAGYNLTPLGGKNRYYEYYYLEEPTVFICRQEEMWSKPKSEPISVKLHRKTPKPYTLE